MPNSRKRKGNTILRRAKRKKGRPSTGRGYAVTVYLNQELARLVESAAKAEGLGKGKEGSTALLKTLVEECVA